MNFADIMREETTHTYTENGAKAKNTSGDNLVNLYSCIGALREADESRITRLFEDAYSEDKLLAAKILFYARDIRGGLGERKIFRTLIKYLAMYHPEAIKPNLDLIGVYGRYDDMYELIGTPLELDMWAAMKKQLDEDITNLTNPKGAVSLLAKWIKTPDASSPNTRKLGILTAHKLGYQVYDFKRILRQLRKRINIVEALMSAQKWDSIEYSQVPSRAMKLYAKAFLKHDQVRFNDFTSKALNGEVKINSSTLYPYDIVLPILYPHTYPNNNKDILEAQWRQLPNYVQPGSSAIVMADVSGSMTCSGGRPMATSIGLAIYFAERNEGPYKNLFMTFSEYPKFETIKGSTLEQKIMNCEHADWGCNTDLEAAFNKILDVACDNHLAPKDMPEALIIVSDMEIDRCEDSGWSFYDYMATRYESKGYKIPNVIFWNVNSRNDIFHADSKRKGVQLVSGQSAAVFKQLMDCVGMTPYEAMLKVLNDERYSAVTVQ